MPPCDPPRDPPCARAAIALLAAGRGSRMGGPKALMPVDDRPWWRSQLDRLALLGADLRWVVTDDVMLAMQRDASLLPAAPTAPPAAPLRFVPVEPARPMFDSILASLEAVLGAPVQQWGTDAARASDTRPAPHPASAIDGVFILPVDVPAPHPDVWAALLDASRAAAHARPVAPAIALTPGAEHSSYVPAASEQASVLTLDSSRFQRGHPIFLPLRWLLDAFRPRVLDLMRRDALHDARLDLLMGDDRLILPVADRAVITNLNTPADIKSWQHPPSTKH